MVEAEIRAVVEKLADVARVLSTANADDESEKLEETTSRVRVSRT